MNHRWKLTLAIAFCAAGIAVATAAEELSAPTARPAVAAKSDAPPKPESQAKSESPADSSPRPEVRSDHPDRVEKEARPHPRFLRPGAASAAANELPTDEQWAEVVEFMGTYSPNRLKAIQDLVPADSNRFPALKKFVFSRYKELKGLQERGDQELYDIRVKTLQAEDQVFGLTRQLRQASPPEQSLLRHQLRPKVEEMMRLAQSERELRINRLEKALAEEKQKLENDKANFNDRLEERMRQIIRTTLPNRDRRSDANPAPSAPPR